MNEKNKRTLVLLDAHAIIHRAYHALPEFISSKGEPTGALYGIVSMLLKIIKDLSPDYIVAAYDLPGPTFRHVAYEGYKASRPKADPALVAQIIRSKDIFKAMNIPIYEAPGFEADDVIGTVVEQLKKEKEISVIIASGDMDTLQLVDNEKVRVYTLKKGINDTIIYDEKAVVARFGFSPKQIPDYKGLRGDPSDNIVGISGIGEKTATILIKEFGTIEALYKTLKKDEKKIKDAGVSPRIVELLKEGEEEALFSKTLAEIRLDAPIKFLIPKNFWKESVDIERGEALLREFEFKSLNERMRAIFGLVPKEKMSVDKEEGKVYQHSHILQNVRMLDEAGEEALTRAQISLWLIDSEKTNPTLEDIFSHTQGKDINKAIRTLEEEIKNKKLDRVLNNIELPLVAIIKKAELRGVLVDASHFKKLSVEYHKKLSALEKKIWAAAGEEFNINSPKQMGVILFDKMRLSAGSGTRMKKTEGGARSTRISELEKIKGAHPIIEEILRHRELQKLLSNYIDAIPPLLDEKNRLHSHFIQTGTTTGRFASANPNLQNIPIKSELGRAVRDGFLAEKGYKLLSFDYSQIELRVAAMLSGDPYLTKVFKEGKDVHASVASRVFHVEEDEVTPEMRRKAKVINFGIVYGMGVSALKETLGGTRAEAQDFYDSYMREFKRIAEYMEEVKMFARKNGYTETLFGRRRQFPGIKSSIPYIRAMAERMATNAPLQGTAADIIKIAIKLADDDLKKEGLHSKVHLLLQIHDELVYEVEDGVVERAEKLIKSAMEGVLGRSFLKNKSPVPLVVNASSGGNWGEV
ncbi:MAG: DNA polymerase [Patescibacteria group bacterium]